MLEVRLDLAEREWPKAKLGTPRRHCVHNAREVVAAQDEARHSRVLLHHAPQRRLRVCRHGVRLIEDDHFERRQFSRVLDARAVLARLERRLPAAAG